MGGRSIGKPVGAIAPAACAAAAEICACFQVRRVARAVTRLFDEVLEPGGLRSTQFVMLVAIRALGEPTLPALAKMLGVDRSTLTRNLAALERIGLVRRVPERSGRMSSAQLTRKGLDALGGAVPLWQKAQSRFVGNLRSHPWERMIPLLHEMEAAART
jgi:DNA-binding MarR family transcriptional regulator